MGVPTPLKFSISSIPLFPSLVEGGLEELLSTITLGIEVTILGDETEVRVVES